MHKSSNRNFFTPVPSDQVQKAVILVAPEFSNLTLAGIMEPLRAANRLSGRRIYDVVLTSMDGGPVPSRSGFSVSPRTAIGDVEDASMLFVVSSYDVEDFCTPSVFREIRRLAVHGTPLGGFETGSFVLAAAGLMDGYKATTHWEDLGKFADRYPGVNVVDDRYVVDRNRATTGGAIPTLDFAINLIRSQYGFAIALDVASTFIYEQESSPRDVQRMLSLGRLKWNEPHLSAAIDMMERNIQETVTIGQIAGRLGVSERTLQRDFVRVLGAPPARFYQWIRLNAGRRLLVQTDLAVAEVAEACGFESRAAFARAFKARFGDSPGKMRG